MRILLVLSILFFTVIASASEHNVLSIGNKQFPLISKQLKNIGLQVGFPSLLVFEGKELLYSQQKSSKITVADLVSNIKSAKTNETSINLDTLSNTFNGLKQGSEYTVILFSVGKGEQKCPPCVVELNKINQLDKHLSGVVVNEIFQDISIE